MFFTDSEGRGLAFSFQSLGRVLAAIVAAALLWLFSSCPASATPRYCPYDIRDSIMYNYLTWPQGQLFDAMYDALYAGEEVVAIPDNLTDDEILWMIDYIYNEAPELCAYDRWNTQVWGYDGDGGWVSTEIHLAYKMPIEEQRQFIADVSEVAASFSGQAESEGIASIYQYVCSRYGYGTVDGADTQLAYFAWNNDVALCNGYAQTMALLCHLAGYRCSYIDGHTYGDDGSVGAHAWNVVAVDDRLYYCDSTWDDAGEYPNWEWYGLSADQMNQRRMPDPEYAVLPADGSMARGGASASPTALGATASNLTYVTPLYTMSVPSSWAGSVVWQYIDEEYDFEGMTTMGYELSAYNRATGERVCVTAGSPSVILQGDIRSGVVGTAYYQGRFWEIAIFADARTTSEADLYTYARWVTPTGE